MDSEPLKLDRIRVQTARMLEVYALLRSEIEVEGALLLSPQDLQRLSRAIAAIRTNMLQLQELLLARREETTAQSEAHEVDEILQAVLRWVQEDSATDLPG
jgi:hypothetical protein